MSIHDYRGSEAVWEEQSNSFLFEFMEESEAIAKNLNVQFNDQGDGYKVTIAGLDHVERSLKCALSASKLFKQLRDRWARQHDAFDNIGFGIGICTDQMSIRRRTDLPSLEGRVLSHSINIAAAMSKFRSSPSEVAVFLDKNTAEIASKLNFSLRGPTQKWLERLGRIYPMYQLELPDVTKRKTEKRESKSKTSKQRQKKRKAILFLAADPTDEVRLRLATEAREIEQKLHVSLFRDKFTFQQKGSVRAEDFSQALLDLKPTIVHFSGHGSSAGEVCFESHDGKSHLVTPEALAGLFGEFQDTVKCVVLNACYSEKQANAIVQHIDYVVGMNDAISDKAAIAFAVGLYQGIGAGKSIEESYRLGCAQIGLQMSGSENLIPLLKKRRSKVVAKIT